MREKNIKRVFMCCLTALAANTYAQNFNWVSSTEGNTWKQSKVKLQSSAGQTPLLDISGTEEGTTFKAWGTTFNELCWDALNMLTRDEQDDLLKKMFSPEGELRFNRGRISMNANDYARDWYSCDEVSGDFQLKYFNINRDKLAIIPFVRAAQKYNPGMTFWMSPWSPPSWMKINNDYPVRSDRTNKMSPLSDVVLYEDNTEKRDNVFPRQLAGNDCMIQDPRYLQTYANFFCKFIDAYKEQGIPIDMIMYQNEAYSYTPYPGCAWTAEGTLRFNVEYLAPTLKKHHPEVALYLGTFTIITKRTVPEGVFFAAITQVVVNQMEGVFARSPVEGTSTAFAFCLHILVLGIFGTYLRQYLSSFPLEANSLNTLWHA